MIGDPTDLVDYIAKNIIDVFPLVRSHFVLLRCALLGWLILRERRNESNRDEEEKRRTVPEGSCSQSHRLIARCK